MLKVPDMVFITLDFIRAQLRSRSFVLKALQPQQLPGERFRTDAKCSLGFIILGGWSLTNGLDTMQADRFSVRLDPGEFPWLFNERGESQWASTAAELLASYVAAYTFGYLDDGGPISPGLNIRVVITGGTDNKANEAVQKRNATTKWPLLALRMQMASTLLDASVRMKLKWRPREENIPADDLTNEEFSKFDPKRRLHPDLARLPMGLFEQLRGARQQFLQAKKNAANMCMNKEGASKRQKLTEKTNW